MVGQPVAVDGPPMVLGTMENGISAQREPCILECDAAVLLLLMIGVYAESRGVVFQKSNSYTPPMIRLR
jgi:hypothetical protein